MRCTSILSVAVLSASLAVSGAFAAGEFGTAKEAEAMVTRAVAHIKAAGKDTAYAAFMNKSGGFIDRDLFVSVIDMEGNIKVHGTSPVIVGKNLMEMKDPAGKLFIKERVEMAKTKTKFWQDYTFFDPLTKKPLPKHSYCEKLDDTLVCTGTFAR